MTWEQFLESYTDFPVHPGLDVQKGVIYFANNMQILHINITYSSAWISYSKNCQPATEMIEMCQFLSVQKNKKKYA